MKLVLKLSRITSSNSRNDAYITRNVLVQS